MWSCAPGVSSVPKAGTVFAQSRYIWRGLSQRCVTCYSVGKQDKGRLCCFSAKKGRLPPASGLLGCREKALGRQDHTTSWAASVGGSALLHRCFSLSGPRSACWVMLTGRQVRAWSRPRCCLFASPAVWSVRCTQPCMGEKASL